MKLCARRRVGVVAAWVVVAVAVAACADSRSRDTGASAGTGGASSGDGGANDMTSGGSGGGAADGGGPSVVRLDAAPPPSDGGTREAGSDGGALRDAATPSDADVQTPGDGGDPSAARGCPAADCGGSDVCCIRAIRECTDGGCVAMSPSASVDYECAPEAECTDGLRRRCLTHADCGGSLCCASGAVTLAPLFESLTSRAGDQRCQAACAGDEAPIECMTARDCAAGQLCCRETMVSGDERLVRSYCANSCEILAQQLCANTDECELCRASLLLPGMSYCGEL